MSPHTVQVQVRPFKHRPPAYAGWDSPNLASTDISPADGHARGTGLNSTAWCELGAGAAAAVGAGATVAERRPVFKAVG
ncbi:MAG: hypothetical protein QE494_15920 [Ramlibacter sp.]|uniref:hypothetical protein n=1 Tax=Ramlibacter sp. TaxID=1917967 RepID=UPI00260F9444|nr:hypothetical protein [Ramlibacter sp.]MDH4377780.1 hypothetical protein [Ramlibacter sp.]